MPEQKSIFYVITKANFGGAQRYVYDLARAAQKDGYAVTVVYGEEGLLSELLEKNNIPTLQIQGLGRDISLGGDIRAFFTLVRLFWNTHPDVVHLNSSKIGFIGALAARLVRIRRIIFTAHGWASTEDRPDWQKAIITMLHWWTVFFSHITIAVSERTKQEMIHLPFMKRKILVIHNAINTYSCYPKDEARGLLSQINSGAPIPKDGLWVGMTAELHPNKGIDVAVNGFADVANKHSTAHLVILGSGEKLFDIISQVEKRGLGERVHLLGFIPEAGVYMQAFDIFLFPSRKEGFPYAILEAGYAGVPTIASAVGGIPEAIHDMETGILIHPRNPQEVSRALDMLISDHNRRGEMGVAFQRDIMERFSFSSMWNKTVALYH